MAKLVLLTTLLILIPLTTSTPTKTKDNVGCPVKWVKFGHSCYKLIKDKYRWHDAQAVCKRLDSTLVNIGSTQEDTFVQELSHNKGVSAWIGLSDVVKEGSFVWIDTQEDPKYTNWFKGEPDNYKGKEDCVELAYDQGGKWNDADCENKFSAVCEKPSDDDDEDEEETKDNGGCPAKWVKFGHSCYKLIKHKYTWFDAQAVCKTLDSTLVNIGSTQEDKFVIELSHNEGVSTWIGLSDMVEEGSFVWIDTQEDPKYTNWFKEQPDNCNGKEDCVELEYDDKGKWNDADCENNFSAVCEKPSDDDDEDKEESKDIPRCPDKWLVFGHSCYKLLIKNHTWHDAQAMCKALNSDLVNIGSKEEDIFLVTLTLKYEVTAWTGLNDIAQEGNFEWADTHEHPIYTHWLSGEPNNAGGIQDCVILWYDHGGRWSDDDCKNTRGSAICEKPFDMPKDIPRCPDKWLVFGHSCYKLLKENHTWHDSQAICKTLNSYLVNIGSKEENLFLVTLTYNYEVTAWIGLNDIAQEGKFEWADTHEHPIYTHWLSGEPNNAHGRQDCVILWYDHGGRWTDDNCNKTRVSAICEKPFDMIVE